MTPRVAVICALMMVALSGCSDLVPESGSVAGGPPSTAPVETQAPVPTAPPASPARTTRRTTIITEVPAQAPVTSSPSAIAPPTIPPTPTPIPTSARPAKAGTYHYQSESRSSNDDQPREGKRTLVAEPSREVEGETRQAHLRKSSMIPEEQWAWRDDGIYLIAARFVIDEQEYACDYEPPVLLYPFPLEVGRSWSVYSRCTEGDPDEKPSLVRDSAVKILAVDRITVGGDAVDVYVIESLRESRAGLTRNVWVDTEFFAPAVGLPVRREHQYQRFVDEELKDESWSTSELVKLSPD